MPNNNTSHRNTRDERKAKELADLRRENQQLHRQVARLRKERDRLQELVGKHADEQFYSPLTKEPKAKVFECECGGKGFLTMTLPSGKDVSYCRECKTRIERKDNE